MIVAERMQKVFGKKVNWIAEVSGGVELGGGSIKLFEPPLGTDGPVVPKLVPIFCPMLLTII